MGHNNHCVPARVRSGPLTKQTPLLSPHRRYAKTNKDRLYYEHVEREQAAALYASITARRTTLASQKAIRDEDSQALAAIVDEFVGDRDLFRRGTENFITFHQRKLGRLPMPSDIGAGAGGRAAASFSESSHQRGRKLERDYSYVAADCDEALVGKASNSGAARSPVEGFMPPSQCVGIVGTVTAPVVRTARAAYEAELASDDDEEDVDASAEGELIGDTWVEPPDGGDAYLRVRVGGSVLPKPLRAALPSSYVFSARGHAHLKVCRLCAPSLLEDDVITRKGRTAAAETDTESAASPRAGHAAAPPLSPALFVPGVRELSVPHLRGRTVDGPASDMTESVAVKAERSGAKRPRFAAEATKGAKSLRPSKGARRTSRRPDDDSDFDGETSDGSHDDSKLDDCGYDAAISRNFWASYSSRSTLINSHGDSFPSIARVGAAVAKGRATTNSSQVGAETGFTAAVTAASGALTRSPSEYSGVTSGAGATGGYSAQYSIATKGVAFIDLLRDDHHFEKWLIRRRMFFCETHASDTGFESAVVPEFASGHPLAPVLIPLVHDRTDIATTGSGRIVRANVLSSPLISSHQPPSRGRVPLGSSSAEASTAAAVAMSILRGTPLAGMTARTGNTVRERAASGANAPPPSFTPASLGSLLDVKDQNGCWWLAQVIEVNASSARSTSVKVVRLVSASFIH